MAPRFDFFISYNSADEAYALWIEGILRESGFTSIVQAIDFLVGSNFVVAMHDATQRCDRVVLVLSHNFLAADFTAAEWAPFFAADPKGHKRLMLPIKIDDCEPNGLLKTVVYLNIYGLKKEEAKAKILKYISADPLPRPPPAPFPRRSKKTSPVSLPQHFLRPIIPAEVSIAFKSRRYLQVALDVDSMPRAIALAEVCAQEEVDFIEVGDPLIKRFGMAAVSDIKTRFPGIPLVAEFSSSDWADEQISIAAQAGADFVMLLGLNTRVRIERAIVAARTQGVGVFLGAPQGKGLRSWVAAVQAFKADAIAVIRNIDDSDTINGLLKRLNSIRAYSDIPISISGGLDAFVVNNILPHKWSIVIVGRSVVTAHNPKEVIHNIKLAIRGS